LTRSMHRLPTGGQTRLTTWTKQRSRPRTGVEPARL